MTQVIASVLSNTSMIQEEQDLFLALNLQEAEYLSLEYQKEVNYAKSPQKNNKVSLVERNTEYVQAYFNDNSDYSEDSEDYMDDYDDILVNSKNKRNKKLKDSSNIETCEGIDKNTRLLLFKLQNADIIAQMNGIVAQGKEAFVFHSLGNESASCEYATKIFKTTKIEFKNREIYIEGEWRFRFQSASQNPRKIIPLWAEKEYRNLTRIHRSGIPCPAPIYLKKHIIVMEFIGTKAYPAPKLSSIITKLNIEEKTDLYWQAVILLKRMYHEAELVHADFGAFNLLVHKDKLIVIDLAQAVSISHPNSIHFLRRDCYNISNFFYASGVATLSTRDLFEYITVKVYNADEKLIDIFDSLSEKVQTSVSQQDKIEETIWLNLELPKSLKDLLDPEAIIEGSVIHSSIQSMKL